MRQGLSRSCSMSRTLGAAIVGFTLLSGCAAAPKTAVVDATAAPEGPAASAAVADVTVLYKGEPLSQSRIAAHLGQEARVDTTTDDGHSASVKLVIVDDGAGNYRTAVDVLYDGAAIASVAFLSAPGQSAASESEDVQVQVRVSPGT